MGKDESVEQGSEVFGLTRDFEDLENYIFGLKGEGAMEAFKRLGHIRAVCHKRGLKVYRE